MRNNVINKILRKKITILAEAQNLKQQINTTDREIDAMVYELYGLSDEEITMVENS